MRRWWIGRALRTASWTWPSSWCSLCWLVMACAWSAQAASWIYPPEMPQATIACIDACAAACGLTAGEPTPLSLPAVVRQRRHLAGAD